MSLRSKAVNGFIWSFADKVGNQLVHFAVIIFLANKIGPEAFGLVGMLAIFVVFAESLVNNGFSQALIQRSKRATDKDFSTVFYTNVLLGITIYFVLFFAFPYIADFYGDERLEDAAQVLFLIVVINGIAVVARARLAIDIDFKKITIANTVATFSGASVGIVMAVNGFGYWSLVWMTITQSLINTSFLWCLSGWFPSLVYSKKSIRSLLGFGSNLMVAGVIATATSNLYVFMVGRYFESTRVGYLTQSTTLTNTISGVISSVLQGVTYPIMTSVNEDEQRMVKIYKQLIQITCFISVPVMIGFAATADSFTKTFLSEEWMPIIPLLVFFSLARLFTPISSVNMNILNAIGRSDLFLKVDLFKLPITLLAVFISAPMGIYAVSIAVFATAFIAYFINSYYPGKFFGFGAIQQIKLCWRILISAILMAVLIQLISIDNSLLELIVKIVFGAIIYISFCYFLKEPALIKIHGLVKSFFYSKKNIN